MPARRFHLVDVFSEEALGGNPLAVVHDAGGLPDGDLHRFARWVNLSETTFVLPPTDPRADYRVRILSPTGELPFAGHPTLGSAHAWLEAGGVPQRPDVVVQQCGAGLAEVRRRGERLAFAAPPLLREGPVDQELVDHLVRVLGADPASVRDARWLDNGPGWVALLLDSAESVLALRPGPVDLDVGVVGPHTPGSADAVEVRAFFPVRGATVEDPVTGSLNAALAGWLAKRGYAVPPYTARQGTVLGRSGRVHLDIDAAGTVWAGGATRTVATGSTTL
ncbi:MAG TPA: PhzF family phenazine biosynthesis protein [Dermatophilaceae bacterium]|nr:PhzF family phenazine biosynthesis protein [Dermatophilaceae bacterium]